MYTLIDARISQYVYSATQSNFYRLPTKSREGNTFMYGTSPPRR